MVSIYVISLVSVVMSSNVVNTLKLGDEFPDFRASTTDGDIQFHDWIGYQGWAFLFSYNGDFQPVSMTELASINHYIKYFHYRRVKPIAISNDSIETHKLFIEDIKDYRHDTDFHFPIISDHQRNIAVQLGMLNSTEADTSDCRTVFIIGPEYRLKLSMTYPETTGFRLLEIMRIIDSLMLRYNYDYIMTPADWEAGDRDQLCLYDKRSRDEGAFYLNGVRHVKMKSGKMYVFETKEPDY